MSEFDTIDGYISEGNVTIEASMSDGNTIIEVNLSNSSTYGFSPIAPRKAINFYDYDGTIFASWTLAELANATALPTNPSHAGLTAQGWNWTLADLKTENRAIDVGQMYITDDGKTRLYITIAALGRMTVPLYWSQTVDSGVTIDWGDGSTPETFTGTGNKNTTHVYAAIGEYIISLEVTAGVLGLGDGTATYCVLGATSTAGRVYTNMLQKIEIGSGVTSIGTYAFQNCYSLASVIIPISVTSIGAYAFYVCYSLASVIIPNRVTSISAYTFNTCSGMAEYHFQRTTPPTLVNINAFDSIPADCKIYVPMASLAAYQAATNWSTYAAYMIGE